MRMFKKVVIVLFAVAALFAGCGAKEDKAAVQTTTETTYFEGTVLDTAENMLLIEPLEDTRERNSADQIWVGTQNISEESAEALNDIKTGDTVSIKYDGGIAETYPAQISGACEIQIIKKAVKETQAGTKLYGEQVKIEGIAVGILAHIKEINGNEILISSDSDGFPGAFNVEVPEEVFDLTKLSGGMSVQILMQDKEETDTINIPEYLAKDIIVLEEAVDETQANKDVLLMEPPVVTLSDPLSSLDTDFEIYAGDYSWNCMYEGEMIGVIACGTHPMDEYEREKLKLPHYQHMDAVSYFFSAAVAPDLLKIRKWDSADIGNANAEEISVITYYYQLPMVELEPGRVYEFTASWKEDYVDLRGFYGEASYTLVTE